MTRILAARRFTRIVTNDSLGRPWHVSGSGRVWPVRFDVNADLVHRDGNARPYFSITADVRRRIGGGDRFLAGGAMHGEILALFPNVQPLVAVHLSDDRGVPMHAAANASYFAGESQYHGADVPNLAKHLRVSVETASEMMAAAAADGGADRSAVWAVLFDTFGLFDRWAGDAATARGLLHENAAVVGAA